MYTLNVLIQIFTGPRLMFTQGTSKSEISISNFNSSFDAREFSVNSSYEHEYLQNSNFLQKVAGKEEKLDNLNFFVFQVSTSTKLEIEEELDLTDKPKDQKQILVLELKTMPEGKNRKAVK